MEFGLGSDDAARSHRAQSHYPEGSNLEKRICLWYVGTWFHNSALPGPFDKILCQCPAMLIITSNFSGLAVVAQELWLDGTIVSAEKCRGFTRNRCNCQLGPGKNSRWVQTLTSRILQARLLSLCPPCPTATLPYRAPKPHQDTEYLPQTIITVPSTKPIDRPYLGTLDP